MDDSTKESLQHSDNVKIYSAALLHYLLYFSVFPFQLIVSSQSSKSFYHKHWTVGTKQASKSSFIMEWIFPCISRIPYKIIRMAKSVQIK